MRMGGDSGLVELLDEGAELADVAAFVDGVAEGLVPGYHRVAAVPGAGGFGVQPEQVAGPLADLSPVILSIAVVHAEVRSVVIAFRSCGRFRVTSATPADASRTSTSSVSCSAKTHRPIPNISPGPAERGSPAVQGGEERAPRSGCRLDRLVRRSYRGTVLRGLPAVCRDVMPAEGR